MSAILAKEDITLFFKLYFALLRYVNLNAKIISPYDMSAEEFIDLITEEKVKIREHLYQKPNYFDLFLKSDHAKNLTADQLEIVAGWKHYIKGRFYIFKHLKNQTIFLDDSRDNSKAYAVTGISYPLASSFISPPTLVEAVLIPFKNYIIYDSFLSTYSIFFGPGIKSSLKDSYDEAKLRYGLITQLPFQNDDSKIGEVEQLKFYMKNKNNREFYQDEIAALSLKSSELSKVYYLELGKCNAPNLSKKLKKAGLNNKWFGTLGDTIVASGVSKDQLEKNIREVVPFDNVERVYTFKT